MDASNLSPEEFNRLYQLGADRVTELTLGFETTYRFEAEEFRAALSDGTDIKLTSVRTGTVYGLKLECETEGGMFHATLVTIIGGTLKQQHRLTLTRNDDGTVFVRPGWPTRK